MIADLAQLFSDAKEIKRVRLVCKRWFAQFDAPTTNRSGPLSITFGNLGSPLPMCLAGNGGVYNVHAYTTFARVLRDLASTWLDEIGVSATSKKPNHISITVRDSPRCRIMGVMIPDETQTSALVADLQRYFESEATGWTFSVGFV